MDTLNETLRRTKLRLLQMHFEAKTGHIGGNLSCIDILMAFFHVVKQEDDQFILSKGHAAGALYATLWSLGLLRDDDLATFHKDDTQLSGHPAPRHLPQIPFATGSLGHGLSLAAGVALARRIQRRPGRVYCLLSDGEWQEGSNWEALVFVIHHALPVTLIVDTNGLQGFGSTRDIAGQEPLTAKFRAFGAPVVEIDGHNIDAICDVLATQPEGPQAVVALTRKGNGVSFMQDQMQWHYLPLSEAQYRQAVEEITTS